MRNVTATTTARGDRVHAAAAATRSGMVHATAAASAAAATAAAAAVGGAHRISHAKANASPFALKVSQQQQQQQLGLLHPELFLFCGECSNTAADADCPSRHQHNNNDDDDDTEGKVDSRVLVSAPAATTTAAGAVVVVVDGESSAAEETEIPLQPQQQQQLLQPQQQQQQQEVLPLLLLLRSTFVVQGICCATEVPAVRRILRPHCERVQISLATKRVTVTHYYDCQTPTTATAATPVTTPTTATTIGTATAASELARILTEAGFPARHVESSTVSSASNGAFSNGTASSQFTNATTAPATTATTNTTKHPRRSPFVESTISVVSNPTTLEEEQGFTVTSMLKRVTKQNFPITAVRAVHPVVATGSSSRNNNGSCSSSSSSSSSWIIKVEHDPLRVGIFRICSVLQTSGYFLDATVLTDGAAEQLYLPETTTTTGHGVAVRDGDYADGCESAPMMMMDHDRKDDDPFAVKLELNVILSGIFWAVSMPASLAPPGSFWSYFEYFGVLSVIFGLPPVMKKAVRTVRRCQFDSNCMMVTAALGACVLGEWDEAASVSFLFACSDYMEARASSRAREALEAIVQLRPEHAAVIHEETREITIVSASQVPVHSLLSVRTGDKIAADGVVVEGTSSIDQSSLTGESVPIQVTAGSTVSGGSINVGSTRLVVRTTVSVEDSAVSRLIRLVEDAQANRSPTEKMVDSFARAYTPAVLALAVTMATLPWLWGTETGRYWTLNGLILIVIACPCALTISTPVTYAAALAATAQRGIVCKGGASLEALGSVKTVVLDKTGTITEGKFAVTAMVVIGERRTRHEMLALLSLMEAPSSHPLSATLVQAAKLEGVSIPNDANLREHSILAGEGVTASVNGKQVYVGNRRLFERIGMYESLPLVNKNQSDRWGTDHGGTVGFIGVENEGIVGSFCVTDVVRPEARETIEALLLAGVQVLMLTGDGEGAAKAVARQVGLPDSAIHSQLLPEDKLHFVASLKSPAVPNSFGLFRQQPTVLFCGDGVNDAPALASADVGISMGEGAALAMEMSDVTLMDSNLSKLLFVIHMGSKVLHTIRENILLSLLCKLLVVALTFGGYMTLLGAIASDVGVMLLVTLNGMKLLPRSSEAVSLDIKRSSRFHARKSYAGLPMTSESETSRTNVAELDCEVI